MPKRTKQEQEILRKTAVANAFNQEAQRKQAVKNASGGELNKPLRTSEQIVKDALSMNVPITERELRKANLSQEQLTAINQKAEEQALKTITEIS